MKTMTAAQHQEYRQAMTHAYLAIAGSDPDDPSNVIEAMDNLMFASERIRACQLLALNVNEDPWESDFEMIRALQAIGIPESEFQEHAHALRRQFLDTPTDDATIQCIQSWYQVVRS